MEFNEIKIDDLIQNNHYWIKKKSSDDFCLCKWEGYNFVNPENGRYISPKSIDEIDYRPITRDLNDKLEKANKDYQLALDQINNYANVLENNNLL